MLYRINKHSLNLPCHNKETEKIVHANQRMGIGVTGYLQATEEQRQWLPDCYEELRAFDKEYSASHGFPVSVKLTTQKPSGTLSLLPGVTPGAHPGYAQHMIRRIRISSSHPLVQVVKDHGYHVEFAKNFDGTNDHSTVVAEFPFSYPEGTVLAKDLTAIDELEVVRRLQREWSDNAVSCTIYYRKEELPEIKKYLLENYNKNFKSISFLLHSGHGFVQAPMEEITEEHYITRKTSIILNAYLNLNGTSRDVRFENSNGDVLSTSVLGTIVTAINVGTYNTPALSVVSGVLPLIKPDTTWYRVAIYNGTKQRSEWITFNLADCGIEDNSILYVDKYGSILSIPMVLRSTLRTNVTNEVYNSERKGLVSGGTWKPKETEYGTININNKKTSTLELNTMFMTEAEQNNFFEMIESPRKMLFRNGEFIPVICETKTAEVKSSVHGRVWQYSVTVSFSNNSAVNG